MRVRGDEPRPHLRFDCGSAFNVQQPGYRISPSISSTEAKEALSSKSSASSAASSSESCWIMRIPRKHTDYEALTSSSSSPKLLSLSSINAPLKKSSTDFTLSGHEFGRELRTQRNAPVSTRRRLSLLNIFVLTRFNHSIAVRRPCFSAFGCLSSLDFLAYCLRLVACLDSFLQLTTCSKFLCCFCPFTHI